MRNLGFKKAVAALLAMLLLFSALPLSVSAASDTSETDNSSSISYTDRMMEQVSELLTSESYEEYSERYASVPMATDTIEISGAEYDKENTTDTAVEIGNFGGEDNVLKTSDTGEVSWRFTVPKDARYVIDVYYYPIEFKKSDIERILKIDDNVPFTEARNVVMQRVWQNEYTSYDENGTPMFEINSIGSEMRPERVECPEWVVYTMHDTTGYVSEDFAFYLSEGEHTISLQAAREELVVGKIVLRPADEPAKSYAELQAEYEQKGYQPVSEDAVIRIDAEKPSKMSNNSIFCTYDRSSAITDPQDPAKIRYNTIGSGTGWQTVGMWIEWEFTVEESGIYDIYMRYRQNTLADIFTCRKLTINGELPFAEAEALRYKYSEDWQAEKINDGEETFSLYFEAGQTYTLRLEVVLGELAELLGRINDTVTILNTIYMKIQQITGADPDQYRDYNFVNLIPDEMNQLLKEAENLKEIGTKLEAIAGMKGSNISTLEEIWNQLEQMGKDEDVIAANMSDFKTNIGTLGSWVSSVTSQPLELDYIQLQSPNADSPQVEANFWQKTLYELQQFFCSFYTSYDSIEGVEVKEDTRTVLIWVEGARERAQLMKQMCDEMFTAETGIVADLKLMVSGAILPATFAGLGPDVYSTGEETVINYAVRGAVRALNESFDDVEEVIAERYTEETMKPYTFEGNVYALPDTLGFCMLYYRADILHDLGLDVPKTWDDVRALLPVLQANGMSFGMPANANTTITGQVTAKTTYLMFLAQNGGQLYNDNNMEVDLNSDVAIEAFEEFTDFYTQYQFDYVFDFSNRFRSGEMPLAIYNYETYTSLSLFATELKGLWSFTTVPGVLDEDGNVHNYAMATGSGYTVMTQAKNPEEGWEYIKWWTGEDAQTRYGVEYEMLVGQGIRHTTANREAIANQSWTTVEAAELQRQYDNVRTIPAMPGSYVLDRYINFAFLNVYNGLGEPAESLVENIKFINAEISRKRKEFGLPTLEDIEENEKEESSTE